MINKAKYYLTTKRLIRTIMLIPRSAYLCLSGQSRSGGFFEPKLGLHHASRAIYTNANCVSSYMHLRCGKVLIYLTWYQSWCILLRSASSDLYHCVESNRDALTAPALSSSAHLPFDGRAGLL